MTLFVQEVFIFGAQITVEREHNRVCTEMKCLISFEFYNLK